MTPPDLRQKGEGQKWEEKEGGGRPCSVLIVRQLSVEEVDVDVDQMTGADVDGCHFEFGISKSHSRLDHTRF